MFNRNEWLQWAQQSQKGNTEMNDFRNEYWRKNDATRSYLNQNHTVKEDSRNKNEPIELNEGVVGDFAKWATGTHRPVLRSRKGDVFHYPSKFPKYYEHGSKLGEPHPKAGKPHPKAGKPIRIKPGEIWKNRIKQGATTGGHLAGQWAVFGGLRGQPKEKKPDVGQSSHEFDEAAPKKPIRQSQVRLALQGEPDLKVKKRLSTKQRLERPRQHVPGETTLVVRDGKVKAIDKGEVKPDDILASSVRYVGNDLQEAPPIIAAGLAGAASLLPMIPMMLMGKGKKQIPTAKMTPNQISQERARVQQTKQGAFSRLHHGHEPEGTKLNEFVRMLIKGKPRITPKPATLTIGGKVQSGTPKVTQVKPKVVDKPAGVVDKPKGVSTIRKDQQLATIPKLPVVRKKVYNRANTNTRQTQQQSNTRQTQQQSNTRQTQQQSNTSNKVIQDKPKQTQQQSTTGSTSKSAGDAAAKKKPGTLKKVGSALGTGVIQALPWMAMGAMQRPGKETPVANAANPTGTAREGGPLARIGPTQQQQRMAASYDPEGTELNG